MQAFDGAEGNKYADEYQGDLETVVVRDVTNRLWTSPAWIPSTIFNGCFDLFRVR